jgi:hypothetical protein
VPENKNVEGRSVIKHELESLSSKIKQIRKLEVGINFNTVQDAYDLGLVSEFATKDDLDLYQNHLEHQRVAGLLRRLRESRIVVDYEM